MGTIRIVCHRGRYKLYHVKYDEDGEVDKVYDEVVMVGKTPKELRHLIEEALQGMTQGVVMLNSCNERILKG